MFIKLIPSIRNPSIPILKNDTVFFWRATSFFPAYFFNLNTGDTLSYFHVYNSTCSPDDSIVKIRIDTAGTFQHDGYSLRYYVGKPIGDVATTWGQSSIKVLERIGVLEYFIDPYFLCLTDYDTYSLRCYKDDAFGTYQNTATDCDYLVSIKNEPDDLPVRIFPNPASTDVMIDYGFTDWSKAAH
ncbi:MAG: hypothetical protein IPP77_06765 [Bacteroidetes bacterium]|nr:hypothetical protein [Bacteroidota bacterium]